MILRTTTTSRRSARPASFVTITLVVLVPLAASADPPARPAAPSASAASAGNGSAVSAGPAGGARPAVSGSAALALPRFQDDPTPEEKSGPPTKGEWESGLPIRFDRPLPPTCSARKVREWVRVHCEHRGARLALIAGDPEGYSGFLPGVVKGAYGETIIPTAFDIQLPLRRGDRKLVAVDRADLGYNLPEARQDFFVAAHWIPPAAPRLVAQRRD